MKLKDFLIFRGVKKKRKSFELMQITFVRCSCDENEVWVMNNFYDYAENLRISY
jgi:hypothetical protein